ncbi:MAG: tRNA preQ1(34) S-adenosylmethionine ribosyltransferase-isomerase QueA [Cardiobacteriaceae bacterium]|nr:tRNA preQ1(34) S-adenosylmethionine ribosyltransferase-isomerase QueA [Cardiobacteriaceae bacterium]
MSIYTKADFNYSLPDELIARFPLEKRSASRLLVANPQSALEVQLSHHHVFDFLSFVDAKDLLVFNNTRVIPARCFGKKPTGGHIEIMIERLQSTLTARAYLRASKTPKIGSIFYIGDTEITVTNRDASLFELSSPIPFQQLLEQFGEIPIPPYMERRAESLDQNRYQTIYAKHSGAVAAPTAGLHFDEALFSTIHHRQIPTTEVTLHVGAGTFQPVRHDDLNQHVMHEEWFDINQETIQAIQDCRERGGRVIAIGTTSLRALESLAQQCQNKALCPMQGETRLFIKPPYQFQVVDALFTNFHLPESTLLMLVSAFLGFDNTRKSYEEAIKQHYRFYSYGDAMFIPKRCPS